MVSVRLRTNSRIESDLQVLVELYLTLDPYLRSVKPAEERKRLSRLLFKRLFLNIREKQLIVPVL